VALHVPQGAACPRPSRDLAQLGVGWVRVDAGHGDGDLTGVRRFISRAHARGLKVLVLVHPGSFSASSVDVKNPAPPLQSWVNRYVATLRRLLDVTLTGTARPDALELGNEPNMAQSDINAGAFAVLHDRVWRNVRAGRANPPFIVSGGVLNVWVGQPWWRSFFYLLELMRKAGGPRPWDAVAIHPYHADTYRRHGAAEWSTVTRRNIRDLQSNLTRIYGGPSRLWVTEIGWASSRTKSDGSFAGEYHPSAASQREQAELMTRADNTLSDLVDVTFWYVYRDDEPGPGTEHNCSRAAWRRAARRNDGARSA
jgi:hypothetical protein